MRAAARNRHLPSNLEALDLCTRLALSAAMIKSKLFFRLFILLAVLPALAFARGNRGGGRGAVSLPPGQFDYYLLSLTWSPAFCAASGPRANGHPVCTLGEGFVVHGLWPQLSAGGYPEFCAVTPPVTAETAAPALTGRLRIADGREWFLNHEWSKHGTCSGLSQAEYFQMTAAAAARIEIPAELLRRKESTRDSAQNIRRLFMAANPGMQANHIRVKLNRAGHFSEVNICLSKALEFTNCDGFNDLASNPPMVVLPAN